jgi:hypothetical protein
LVEITLELLGILIPVFGGGIAIGKYFPKKSNVNSQQQLVDWGLIELRGRIRWTNEVRTRLLERISNSNTHEVNVELQILIDELNRELGSLQRALNGTLDN